MKEDSVYCHSPGAISVSISRDIANDNENYLRKNGYMGHSTTKQREKIQ